MRSQHSGACEAAIPGHVKPVCMGNIPDHVKPVLALD